MNVIQFMNQANSLSPAIKKLLKESEIWKNNNKTHVDDNGVTTLCSKSKLTDTEFRVTQNKETERFVFLC